MPDKNMGLYGKYSVSRVDGKPMNPAFVLEYGRDPFAVIALEAYAEAVKHTPAFQVLAQDLLNEIQAIHEHGLRCRLDCPKCGTKHVDEGEWATRKHKTHQCQACMHEWRPFEFPTFGIAK